MKKGLEFKLVVVLLIIFLAGAAGLGLMAHYAQMTVAAIIAAVVASMFFSLLLWIMLRKMVIYPLKKIEAAAAKVSEGDFTFGVDISTADEIGRMSRIFKDSLRSVGAVLMRVRELSDRIMTVSGDVEKESKKVVHSADTESEAVTNIASSVEQLKATATEIADNTEGLAGSMESTSASVVQMASSISSVNENARELSFAVESTSSSIEELSATIREIAANTDELSKASDETLSAISEITSSVKEVELNTRESARLSEKVTNDATTYGMTSIQKTTEGMENIKKAVEHTAGIITQLGGRSSEIGNILDVIDEVTDQTTLLALNAAILAAQAGEHGRGFSVVADEIKDLAERTAFSTKEIAALIKAVQQEVKNAAEAMQGGQVLVNDGLKLAREAGEALRKIVESSKKSAEMAVSIEKSTSEQSKAARLVTEAMERVRNMVEQIAKATDEEAEGVNLMMKATEKMREVSRQVSRSTDEQALSSRQIAEAIEIVSRKTQQISRSLINHKAGTQYISEIVEKVKTIPTENRQLAFGIIGLLKNLHKDSELLETETRLFRFSEEKSGVLRFGVVPLETPAVMYKKFSSFVNYLSRKLDKDIEIKVAVDFEGAINDIGRGVTQFCYMTPSTYIEAHAKYGVRVILKALRHGRPSHNSAIIIRKGSDIESLSGLKGRTFAFGDARSTSSHIIPRSMLKDAGIELDALRYYNYLGHHDEVAKAVLNGDFDAGAVMGSVAERLQDKGLRILEYSGDIPEFCICSGSLSDDDIASIRSAVLSLNEATAEGGTILRSIDKDYNGFVEAMDSDYDGIRAKMSALNMI